VLRAHEALLKATAGTRDHAVALDRYKNAVRAAVKSVWTAGKEAALA